MKCEEKVLAMCPGDFTCFPGGSVRIKVCGEYVEIYGDGILEFRVVVKGRIQEVVKP